MLASHRAVLIFWKSVWLVVWCIFFSGWIGSSVDRVPAVDGTV